MVAVVLLYVGAVLFLNGIWLIGQTSDSSALKISSKEIAVINVFTGALGFLVAIYSIYLGGARNDIGPVALGGYIHCSRSPTCGSRSISTLQRMAVRWAGTACSSR